MRRSFSQENQRNNDTRQLKEVLVYQTSNSTILSLYAIAPVHAGSGSSFGVVDLPIQRERHTQWPHIQASGVKGALREHFESFYKNDGDNAGEIAKRIFGDSKGEDGTQAGAIAVSDAKLLAFPMRSNIAPFVWITCPAVLDRLNRDLLLCGRKSPDLVTVKDKTSAVPVAGNFPDNHKILLEDMEVEVYPKAALPKEYAGLFDAASRLLVVDDEVFQYGVEQCTEVQPQIAIDDDTGTTVNGSLHYQELLPADAIMYVVMFWGDEKREEKFMKADQLFEAVKKSLDNGHIQMGGDLTLGRGLFSVNTLRKEN